MYGPSLIVAGDNKNANIDPEVVAPLSKLKDMLGGNSVQVYGRISGDDIVITELHAIETGSNGINLLYFRIYRYKRRRLES